MCEQPRSEPLFYYFRLEDQIPDHHLLKRLDRCVDFSFVRERLKGAYSPLGRPSIDPEILLRLLLVGYLYGITSERRLMEEVRMHLAYPLVHAPGIRPSDSRSFDVLQEPARAIPGVGILSGSL
jgi:transposase